MLRGLKKIRKSITEAQQQRNRSSGSSSGDNDDYTNTNNNNTNTNDNDYYYREFEGTSFSTIVPSVTPTGTSLTRNTSQSSTASGGGASGSKMSTRASSVSSTYRSSTKSRVGGVGTTIDKQALLSKSTYLSSFDKCIEASDAMIASSYSATSSTSAPAEHTHRETIFAVRSDPQTGLTDCSLLVSPDGDLLLVPNEPNNIRHMFQPPLPQQNASSLPSQPTVVPKDTEDAEDDDEDIGLNRDTEVHTMLNMAASSTSSTTSGLGNFAELMRQSKEDYESAMFIGNDLHGDKVINRFSAKGWSVPATTLAVQQTEFALQSMARFCEHYVLTRKDSAAKMTMACDRWRSELDQRRGFQTNRKDEFPMSGEQWEILDPRATSFDLSPSRVGPFTSHGSTVSAAAMAIEQYHHEAAEKESNRWRMATLKRDGVVAAMQSSIDMYHTRATKRQQALAEMSHRAQIVEEHIRKLKQKSEQKWDLVYKAEQRVTVRMEELMSERSKERQKARLKLLLREQQENQRNNNNSAATHPITRTDDVQLTCNLSDEVWDMVSSVAESMDHGSFEPIPDTASTISDEASSVGGGPPQLQQHHDRDEVLVSHPIVTREEIEQELGVPELRAVALQVDEELQDESGTLLNIISLLDTTRRSARIAAETCLASAGNAQASCLRNMLQLERESLQERLRDLDGLEQVLDKMDVRADLDSYITSDKKELGGFSHLGDDDDGGIASALAVLSSHVDGIIMGQDSGPNVAPGTSTSLSRQRTMSSEQVPGSEIDEKEEVTTTKLNVAIDKVFHAHTSLQVDDPNSLDQNDKQYYTDFDKNVDFLCDTITGNTMSAQKRRSVLCYLLNSKRGMYAEIPTMKQYNAVSRIFTSLLTNGLDDEEVGISNAKMCMMLAQTFYFLNDPTTSKPAPRVDADAKSNSESIKDEEEEVDSGNPMDNDMNTDDELNQSLTRTGRQYRIYIKNALTSHPIWSNDDFWDIALSQQISESLTHSGVMSNFEARRSIKSRASRMKSHEKSHVTQWYDLNYTERVEAASQVHAVVFAQLGALAHSMIEFDCGLERSCAFVRRMSIRNQLPSSQRTMLLLHLMDRDDVGRRESKLQSY